MRLVALALVLIACGSRAESDKPIESKPPSIRDAADDAAPPLPPAEQCDELGRDVCRDNKLVECRPNGTLGVERQECFAGCQDGACVDTCQAKGVELVYLVDSNRKFLRFDPRKLPGDPFELVGTLSCNPDNSPFSMAVDRRGVAWVVYDTGYLYRVSIYNARCSPVGYIAEPDAPRTFGMGFASDPVATTNEDLFVAANDETQLLGQLRIDDSPPHFMPIGQLTTTHLRNPELTGTADDKLFGYFPEPERGFVQEIDRSRGTPVGPKRFLAPSQETVDAYAFAHFGGVFYIFAATGTGTSEVHAIHRKTGKYERVLATTNYRIVGAGVSTCAPLLERAP